MSQCPEFDVDSGERAEDRAAAIERGGKKESEMR